MSAEAGIITKLYNKLTTDSTLMVLFNGDVRLHYVWAQQDEDFPYLVHIIDHPARSNVVSQPGRYVVDIWDYHATAERILKIKERLLDLLDKCTMQLAEASMVRLNLQNFGLIPTNEKNVWRYSITFNLKYVPKAHLTAITARSAS